MALEKVSAGIPINGGMNTHDGEYVNEPPFFRKLENYRYDREGVLSKRDGHVEVDDTGLPTVQVPNSIFSLNNQLLVNTYDGTYRFETDYSQWVQQNPGFRPTELTAVDRWVQQAQTLHYDCCTSTDGKVCWIWSEYASPLAASISQTPTNLAPLASTRVWVAVTDSDGEMLLPPTRTDLCGPLARVVCLNDDRFVILGIDAVYDLYGLPITTAPGIVVGNAVLLVGQSDVRSFDVDSVPDESIAYVLAANPVGVVTVYAVDASPSVVGTLATGLTAFTGALGVTRNTAAGDVAYVYTESTQTGSDLRSFTTDIGIGALTSGPTTVISGPAESFFTATVCQRPDGTLFTAASLCVEPIPGANAPTSSYTYWNFMDATGVPTKPQGLFYNCTLDTKATCTQPHGKPFFGLQITQGVPYGRPGNVIYKQPVNLMVEVDFEFAEQLSPLCRYHQDETRYAPETDNGDFFARINGGFPSLLASTTTPRGPFLCRANQIGSSTLFASATQLESRGRSWSELYALIGVGPEERALDYAIVGGSVTVENEPEECSSAASRNVAYFSSGVFSVADTHTSAEASPHVPPVLIEADGVNGGVLTADGTYTVTLCHVIRDSAGNTYRSAPSVPIEVVLSGAERSIRVEGLFPPPSNWNRDENVVLTEIYLTDGNPTSTNLLLNDVFRASDFPASTPGHFEYTVLGEQFRDVPLYVQGGVLENNAPPAFLDITETESRMWGISSEDRKQIWPSKTKELTLGPEWSANLTLLLPPAASSATAITKMDDKVVVFTENEIYVVLGPGPNNNAQLGSFEIVQVASDAGCIAKNSVVSGHFGIMFQSKRGICLLDRGLTVSFIGGPVVDYTDGRLVRTAILDANSSLVRFYMNGESGSKWRGLIFDYDVNAWTIDGPLGDPGPIVATGFYENNFCAVQSTSGSPAGRVILETPGQYTDIALPIVTTAETSWLKVPPGPDYTGLMGYRRLYQIGLLGKYFGGNLTVNAAYNYGQQGVTTSTHSWTATEAAAITSTSNNIQLRVSPVVQKTDAVKFTITEQQPPPTPPGPYVTNAGLQLSGIQLLLGMKSGNMKIPATGSR